MTLPRVRATERLDDPDLDERELADSLRHVGEVNRWLGGTRALVRELDRRLPPRTADVLDVGTGAADVPRALVRNYGDRLRITGLDPNPRTLAIARANTARLPISLVQGDARDLPFPDRSFDFSLITLTLHHLDDDDAVRTLREMARVTRIAVIVNELERNRANLLGARLLAATWWRRNPTTRHDGPVSVLRAYKRRELLELARAAGLRRPRVDRRFFFRLVLVAAP